MSLRQTIFFAVIVMLIASCTSGPGGQPVSYPTYDPFVPVQGPAPLKLTV